MSADDYQSLAIRCAELTDQQKYRVLAWLSGYDPEAVRKALDRCPVVDPDNWRDDYRGDRVMTRPPIVIDCEGGHAQGIREYKGEVMCPMCGEYFPGWDGTNELPGHFRQDIIAMIERGDFDAMRRLPPGARSSNSSPAPGQDVAS